MDLGASFASSDHDQMVVWWPVRLEARVSVDVSRTVIWYHLMAGNFVAGKPPPDILVGWFRLDPLPDYRYIISHAQIICICIDRCPLQIPVAWDVSTKLTHCFPIFPLFLAGRPAAAAPVSLVALGAMAEIFQPHPRSACWPSGKSGYVIGECGEQVMLVNVG